LEKRRKSYEKNPTTIFIQLLRTKTIKNKRKEKKYSEKNTKKEEEKKSYLNMVACEAKKKGEKNKFIKYIN
jgi:hypothetical protein